MKWTKPSNAIGRWIGELHLLLGLLVAPLLLIFPVDKPGRQMLIRADLAAGNATVTSKDTGTWDALLYLHKMPGPHVVDLRGNWVFTRIWRWLADAGVYVLLFLTASGIYLWWLPRAERKLGLLMAGAGAVGLALLLAMA